MSQIRSSQRLASQRASGSQQPKYTQHSDTDDHDDNNDDESDNDITISDNDESDDDIMIDDDDDNDDDTTTTTTKTAKAKPPTKKKTTTTTSKKKEYPPFEVKPPKVVVYNQYLKRPMYGDIRPWCNDENGFDMNEPCIVGIDEAGRGPVLGPMVYGTCIVPLSKVTDLKALGVNDSKQLKEIDREYLFSLVQNTNYLRWIVDRILPQELSYKMLAANKESLNLISHLSALHMVCQYIRAGFNVEQVVADTVGPPEKYQAWLDSEIDIFCRRYSIKNPVKKIIVESKADANYPAVSAASICAKVTRDLDLAQWICRENGPDDDKQISTSFGSGYPGDPVTKTWLRDNFDPIFGFPDLVRFSWGTAEKIIIEDGYAVHWGDEEDLPSREATQARLRTGFLSSKTSQQQKGKQNQWSWMEKNNITNTTDLPF